MTRTATSDIACARKNTDLVTLVRAVVPLRRKGRLWVGLCPFHKEKSPSFKVFDDGHFHCFGCGEHGDAIEWIRKTEHLNFKDAVARLGNVRLVATTKRPQPNYTDPKILKARAAWHASAPAAGSIVESYLRSRGLTIPAPLSIRFAPVFNFPGIGAFPAMVTAVQRPDGKTTGIQVTALRGDGSGKADLPKSDQRRTFGALGVGAVRLAKADEVLGIAEGVEDALAGMQLADVPCWACLGAPRMRNVIIPDHVRELHIFADDDDAGRDAADQTAKANPHRRVIIRFPPPVHKDWADVAAATGAK